jgi:hypothetical protein
MTHWLIYNLCWHFIIMIVFLSKALSASANPNINFAKNKADPRYPPHNPSPPSIHSLGPDISVLLQASRVNVDLALPSGTKNRFFHSLILGDLHGLWGPGILVFDFRSWYWCLHGILLGVWDAASSQILPKSDLKGEIPTIKKIGIYLHAGSQIKRRKRGWIPARRKSQNHGSDSH